MFALPIVDTKVTANRTPFLGCELQITEYLVHWEGYPHSEDTWEPERNLMNNSLLKQFKAK